MKRLMLIAFLFIAGGHSTCAQTLRQLSDWRLSISPHQLFVGNLRADLVHHLGEEGYSLQYEGRVFFAPSSIWREEPNQINDRLWGLKLGVHLRKHLAVTDQNIALYSAVFAGVQNMHYTYPSYLLREEVEDGLPVLRRVWQEFTYSLIRMQTGVYAGANFMIGDGLFVESEFGLGYQVNIVEDRPLSVPFDAGKTIFSYAWEGFYPIVNLNVGLYLGRAE